MFAFISLSIVVKTRAVNIALKETIGVSKLLKQTSDQTHFVKLKRQRYYISGTVLLELSIGAFQQQTYNQLQC